MGARAESSTGRAIDLARDPRPAPGAWATHAALLVVQLAFASQAVEAKIAMGPRALGGEGIRPEALAMARMLGATIFFHAFTRARGLLRPLAKGDWWKLAGLSILGISLNQTLFLIGLRLTTATSAALLSVTIPVFSAAMSTLLGHEKASWRLAIGLVLAVAGVVSLTGLGRFDLGALTISVNSLSYAGYIVLSRPVIQRLGAFTTVTWVFTFGALLFLPVGGLPLASMLPALTPRGAGFVAFIVLVPTILAYLANAWALGRSTASLVTIYIYVQPVIAALLSWVQLGEPLRAKVLLAAAFILVGVTIVATGKRPSRGGAQAPERAPGRDATTPPGAAPR